MAEFWKGIVSKFLSREFVLPFSLIIIATAISIVAIGMVKGDGVDAILKVLDTWGQWCSIFAGIAGGGLGLTKFLGQRAQNVASAAQQAQPPAPPAPGA